MAEKIFYVWNILCTDTITAPIDGIVEEILVREGSRIESGDCLLRVEDAPKR